jgi:pilus assembly protein Flp/PilA
MVRSNFSKRHSEGGQGLVEYSLLLALIALVVVVVLVILGPNVGNVYSASADAFDTPAEEVNNGEGENIEEVTTDVVTLSVEGYDPVSQELHLHAYSDGGNDPGITMTASPGGAMTLSNFGGPHYTKTFILPVECPCVVTVTSSEGGSSTVTVP